MKRSRTPVHDDMLWCNGRNVQCILIYHSLTYFLVMKRSRTPVHGHILWCNSRKVQSSLHTLHTNIILWPTSLTYFLFITYIAYYHSVTYFLAMKRSRTWLDYHILRCNTKNARSIHMTYLINMKRSRSLFNDHIWWNYTNECSILISLYDLLHAHKCHSQTMASWYGPYLSQNRCPDSHFMQQIVTFAAFLIYHVPHLVSDPVPSTQCGKVTGIGRGNVQWMCWG